MTERPLISILHVDDNETNRYIVTRTLQKAGFKVTSAATGEAGLNAVTESRPDLIILDVQLPDINGFELCRQIKADPTNISIPVLHLSASFVETKDKAEGLESGADAYLAQPVETIELIATVKALLRMRQAEESALALARQWQTTFDAISDGVCLLNKEGQVLRCNSVMAAFLDKPLTDINDRVLPDVIQDLLQGIDVKLFTRVQQTRSRESIEVQSRDRWYSLTVDPVLDKDRTFVGAVYIISDITNRKSVETALTASEERFRLLLENVKDYAIFFLDPHGRVIRWSAGAEYILGYKEAEALGRHSSFIFTPEELAQGLDRLELEKAATEGQAEDERWHIRKDGSWFWASGIVTPLWDEGGQLRGFAKIMRDFTERKQAEDERAQLLAREQAARAEAESVNRMKDEFLATLSHELRSPLNAMLGWTRLLNSRKFDEKTTVRALETIERTAKAQAQLVEDLLDVSRIIQGKLRLNVLPLELAPVVESALETIRPAAEAKGIELETRIDRAAGMVSGDINRLQQVVWNLLTNAIKFTPKGGRVKIQLHRVDSSVEIRVVDTGQGISPDFVPYVFDRFRQADSSITRSYSGLGLGLAIVRHLIELHGGTVGAASEGEGQGATFTIQLPLMAVRLDSGKAAPGDAKGDELPFNHLPDLSAIQVLVVDDDSDSRLFLSTVLEECGANVNVAASASEALEKLKELKPDVLISDIGMPEEDGYSLIRKVRALAVQDGGNTPAAALTAYAREEDRNRAIAEGFQTHLAKPVDPDALASVVATLAQYKESN